MIHICITPYPLSKGDINKTRNITLIRDKLAEILCLTPKKVEEITSKNAEKAFNLPRKVA